MENTSSELRVVIVTGLSGSGKSVAIRQLEDSGYYCLDNLPLDFLLPVLEKLHSRGIDRIAVAVDARGLTNSEQFGGTARSKNRCAHPVFDGLQHRTREAFFRNTPPAPALDSSRKSKRTNAFGSHSSGTGPLVADCRTSSHH